VCQNAVRENVTLLADLTLWNQSVKALNRQIFTLQKRTVRYMTGSKERESCRDSFRQLKLLTIYSLDIQETILSAKEKDNCTVNKQIHIYNTRNNNYYHKYVHNIELYKSKLSVARCIFYNKLPNNILVKQICNNNQFKKELKNLLINRCYCSVDDYLNEEFCNICY
jgi:hypothetical protein